MERLGGFKQTIKLKDISEGLKHGLDSNASRNDLKVFYLVNDIKSEQDIIMILTPSAISKPKFTSGIIKEEKPDFTDFLYQDAQDP